MIFLAILALVSCRVCDDIANTGVPTFKHATLKHGHLNTGQINTRTYNHTTVKHKVIILRANIFEIEAPYKNILKRR